VLFEDPFFSVWNFFIGQLFIAGNKLTVVKFLQSRICDVINVLKSTLSIFMLFILRIFLHSMLLTSTGKYIKPVPRALFVLGANSYMYRHQDVIFRGVMDLRSFVVNKRPEDGTLVPKHVGVGT
jgi:hypothetical protein